VSLIFVTFAAALSSLVTGADIEFEASGRTENRAGYVPDTVNLSNAVRVIDFELIPSAEVSVLSTDQAFGLRYRPRIFYRIPNDLGQALVLHQFEALYRWRIAPDFHFNFSATVARGDVSYGRLTDIQDQTTGSAQASTIPSELVVHTLSLLALGNVVKRFSPIQTLNIEYRAQLTEAQTDQYVVPNQYLAWLAPTFIQGLDRTNDLQVGMQIADVGFANPTGATVVNLPGVGSTTVAAHRDFFYVQSQIGLRHLFTDRLNATVRLGYAALINDFSQSTPVGDANVTANLLTSGSTRLNSGLTMGVQAYANPIYQAFGPRAFTTGFLELDMLPHLAARLNASIYTPLRTTIPGTTGTFSQQTVMIVRLPVVWTFDENYQLEVGARYAERTRNRGEMEIDPVMHGPTPAFTQLELLAYAAFTVTLGKGAETQRVSAGR
jgi:hypothetical protein